MTTFSRRDLLRLPLLLAAARLARAENGNWPSFRGPQGSGVSDSFPLPTQWQVKWKSPLPGLGHSSPVIWGDRIFVATAVNASGQHPIKLGLYGERDAA